jgi:hypothetical protein
MEVCHTPQEKFEDTKEVIRSHISNKTENTNQTKILLPEA